MFAMFGSLGRFAGTLAVAFTTAATVSGCGEADETPAPAQTPGPGTGGSGQAAPAPGANAACPSLGALKPPVVPPALEPPAGATLMLRYRAEGTQIYTCKATTAADGSTTYAWAFKSPEATLRDESCALAGTHFAGPTWKSTIDNSAVVGMKAAEAPAPVAGAIPWLLLRAMSTSGSGLMSSIVAVQRVDTAGGLAPLDGCDASAVATERAVPYTAVYYFYQAGASTTPSDPLKY
jgi:hypothetical protein